MKRLLPVFIRYPAVSVDALQSSMVSLLVSCLEESVRLELGRLLYVLCIKTDLDLGKERLHLKALLQEETGPVSVGGEGLMQ